MSYENGNHNFDGDHGLQLMSYMYGELDRKSRRRFESHLAACVECALELASLSDARLGMIEWRRKDFDHLVTPEIVLPVTASVTVSRSVGRKQGALGRSIEALTSMPLFAQVRIAFAAAAVVLAIVFVGLDLNLVGPDVASSTNQNGPEIQPPSIDNGRDMSPSVAERVDPRAFEERRDIATPITADRVVVIRKQAHAPKTAVRKNIPAVSQTPKRAVSASSAPRLNTFEEVNDRSLRLTDLFADIGTSDR